MTTDDRRVLIVYGSRNGSTAEIGRWIGHELRERGLAVEVRNVADAPDDISAYDAVVLGAGVYLGRWHRDARRFARRHRQALGSVPVWLFSSGPLDTSCDEREVPAVPGVARLALRLDARGHATFGGRLAPGARGYVARQILREGKGGDFRNEEAIRAWARGVATELAWEPLAL
ncbi:flavodoxin domain-containing protein [Streptomyces sp. NPDC017993]|uniref:flavodoxin domain-containing protein n=1 Tax=Streptomyces sp. NPDC017993 TaxID=3365027 RepID=UPI00378BB28F